MRGYAGLLVYREVSRDFLPSEPLPTSIYSTGMTVLPLSSALGTVTVRMPSFSFAETLLASTGRGSHTVRVKLPKTVRSVEIWLGASAAFVTAVESDVPASPRQSSILTRPC